MPNARALAPPGPVPADAAVVLVHAPVAPLNAEPRVSSGQVSQALAGHPLELLERREDWLRVRGRDAYEGWMHQGYVAAPDALGVPDAIAFVREARCSLGCRVRGARGERSLPLGAWLLPGERVIDGDACAPEERQRRFPTLGPSIAHSAVTAFAATPYQWGGVSPWGADCSGLIQTTFALHGVPLPRDAWQQAETGRDAGADPLALRAADLLFFSDRPDRRITHVGIALGDARMVHLALGRGGWAVEDLRGDGDEYVAALLTRFVAARRVV